jgi:hypothetical protein
MTNELEIIGDEEWENVIDDEWISEIQLEIRFGFSND